MDESCWCGDLAKVKDLEYFFDKFGMKFFMYTDYDHDAPASSAYPRPPLCFKHEE
jgi:hypothetical protein